MFTCSRDPELSRVGAVSFFYAAGQWLSESTSGSAGHLYDRPRVSLRRASAVVCPEYPHFFSALSEMLGSTTRRSLQNLSCSWWLWDFLYHQSLLHGCLWDNLLDATRLSYLYGFRSLCFQVGCACILWGDGLLQVHFLSAMLKSSILPLSSPLVSVFPQLSAFCHMLLLNVISEAYMRSPLVWLHLTSVTLKGQCQGHSHFERLYLEKELS